MVQPEMVILLGTLVGILPAKNPAPHEALTVTTKVAARSLQLILRLLPRHPVLFALLPSGTR